MEHDRIAKADETKASSCDRSDGSLTFLMLLCIIYGPMVVGAFFAIDEYPLLGPILLVCSVVWPIYLWIDRPRM